jgi:hypothetical protein
MLFSFLFYYSLIFDFILKLFSCSYFSCSLFLQLRMQTEWEEAYDSQAVINKNDIVMCSNSAKHLTFL